MHIPTAGVPLDPVSLAFPIQTEVWSAYPDGFTSTLPILRAKKGVSIQCQETKAGIRTSGK
jgi:hypothetical protein